MEEPILTVSNVSKRFGSLLAVDGVSFEMGPNELCAVLGPNGAGKTTLFNIIAGTQEATSGTITFKGEDITGKSADEVAKCGLVRSFQITNIFWSLSVLENIRLGVQSNYNSYNFWRDKRSNSEQYDRAAEIAHRVGLDSKTDQVAAELSHGEQRSLEIGIVLATDPDLLLLDEPSSGMSPEETSDVISMLEELSGSLPLVVIEHKMSVVREVADRIIVMHRGQKIADGRPDAIQEDERVQQVYLAGRTV